MSDQKIVRCAVYTRKSCEDGLEQEFNSLDAQRLAGENYIASQVHENWRLISKHYDDGGFSGGNMDRPALKELFADIESGQIDMVVVYKIDRLSRSLFDFAKIVEIFEKNNVSFVSVTQSFNTSTSMGKLMLNILLSFAQFEREVTSERIRDKFAASKKLGMWMGGYPMLGYDVKDRKLVINKEEAKVVKFIYEQFDMTESCTMVTDKLNRRGYRTKLREHVSGNRNGGGKLFTQKDVRRILTNPYYKGYVTHKGEMYKGEHEAIIPEDEWNRIQGLFKKYDQDGRKAYATSTPSFLKGILKCAKCKAAMTPTYAYNHGLRYRYYVCSNHLRNKSCVSAFKTISADEIEQQMLNEIFKILSSPEVIMNINRIIESDKASSPEILKENIVSALNNLTEVWSFLYPSEQQKVSKMLLDEVSLADNGINVKMNLEGFDRVLREISR